MFGADDILDAGGDLLKTTVNRLWVCSGDPQTYTEASAQLLASKDIDQYAFGPGQDASPDGRYMIMAEQGNVVAVARGFGSHLCFVNTSTSALRYSVSRTFDKEITIGSILTIPATPLAKFRDQTLV